MSELARLKNKIAISGVGNTQRVTPVFDKVTDEMAWRNSPWPERSTRRLMD